MHTLTLPADLPPGEYRVEVLAYPVSQPNTPYRVMNGADTGRFAAAQATLAIAPERRVVQASTAGTQSNDLKFMANALPSGVLMPRDQVSLELTWHAAAAPPQDIDFDVFLAQAGCDTPMLARAQPVRGHATSQWSAGDTWTTRYRARIPACAQAGTHALIVRTTSGQVASVGTLTIGARASTGTVPPVPVLQAARFGDVIQLVGFGLEQGPPNQAARLRVLWRALQESDRDYKISLRVIDPTGNPVFVEDRLTGNWQRPTSTWLPGEYVEDAFVLGSQAGLASCPCKMELIAYDQATGERLPVAGAQALTLAADVPRPR